MRSLLEDTGSMIISYDMKLGMQDKGSLDIHVQIVDKKPKVMQVTRDETKVLIVDVMCLNRLVIMRVLVCVVLLDMHVIHRDILHKYSQ